MQAAAPLAKRILEALVGAGDVAVRRNGDMNPHLAHAPMDRCPDRNSSRGRRCCCDPIWDEARPGHPRQHQLAVVVKAARTRVDSLDNAKWGEKAVGKHCAGPPMTAAVLKADRGEAAA
jgi:hypothetical protein